MKEKKNVYSYKSNYARIINRYALKCMLRIRKNYKFGVGLRAYSFSML